MKRLLMLTWLLIPAVAGAQGVIDTWETYCDNGVERVRATIVVPYQPVFDYGEYWGAELWVYSGLGCSVECGYYSTIAPETRLEDGSISITWSGFSRECLSGATASRHGTIAFFVGSGDSWREERIAIACDWVGPFTITDNANCDPLPTAAATWGSIKALYR